MDRSLFRCTDAYVDATELGRCAYNAAFAMSGLNWHWSEERFSSLLKIAGERHRICWYAEHVKEQPIPSSKADVILWRKEQALKMMLSAEEVPSFIGSRVA